MTPKQIDEKILKLVLKRDAQYKKYNKYLLDMCETQAKIKFLQLMATTKTP